MQQLQIKTFLDYNLTSGNMYDVALYKEEPKDDFPQWRLIFPQSIIILSNTLQCKGWFENIF